jgi:hypothetical protein
MMHKATELAHDLVVYYIGIMGLINTFTDLDDLEQLEGEIWEYLTASLYYKYTGNITQSFLDPDDDWLTYMIRRETYTSSMSELHRLILKR